MGWPAALLLSFLLTTLCLADVLPYYSNAEYNEGSRGRYATQPFLSDTTITTAPIVNFMRPFSNCDDGSYLFLAPRGDAVAHPTLMIMDANGSPVWLSTQNYGQVYNLQVQYYKDQPYLTFWGGNDAVGGHGIGQYFMLDQNYNERFRIEAGNNLGADLHAFTITPEDTALITIYQSIAIDISDVSPGRGRGWIWDSIFQELDLETGEVVFEWHASTHIPVGNSYDDVNAAVRNDPWDVYHINSVEKDDLGNYLISMRFLRAILYIDGKTGDVLWQLGGKQNSFSDLSDGKATAFLGQHDAHWYDGHKFITFFDNRADWYCRIDEHSQGTRIEVDLKNMTARLDATFVEPYFDILSTSQGSHQNLPNGNVLVGYGFNGVVAEFSPTGELLCDAYLQPASNFGSGDVQSYRNLKFNWTGFPDTDPNLVFRNGGLYMSWNGATEVATWLIVGSDISGHEEESQPFERNTQGTMLLEKKGFETVYHLSDNESIGGRFLRVIALDESGFALGTSNSVDLGDSFNTTASEIFGTLEQDGNNAYIEDDFHATQILLALGAITTLSAVLVFFLALRKDGSVSLCQGDEDGGEQAVSSMSPAEAWRGMLQFFQGLWRRRERHEDDRSAETGLLENHSLIRKGTGDDAPAKMER